jgi:hypothetical protein
MCKERRVTNEVTTQLTITRPAPPPPMTKASQDQEQAWTSKKECLISGCVNEENNRRNRRHQDEGLQDQDLGELYQ